MTRFAGSFDEGCVCDCLRSQVTYVARFGSEPGGSFGPQVASSSRGFDLVWIDERDGNPEILSPRSRMRAWSSAT